VTAHRADLETAVAFHRALALKEGTDPADVQAFVRVVRPRDSKFAALSVLANAMIEKRGRLSDEDVDRSSRPTSARTIPLR
jgi:predicted protein tyrosine phosphatase